MCVRIVFFLNCVIRRDVNSPPCKFQVHFFSNAENKYVKRLKAGQVHLDTNAHKLLVKCNSKLTYAHRNVS